MHGKIGLLIGFSFVTADRQQMQALVCLAELEGLHIQQSASTFDKCNKEGLVRGLWRNHKHERKVRVIEDYLFSVLLSLLLFSGTEGKGVSLWVTFQAVRLVADLCLDNNIHDSQLWNSVLQQLLTFRMVSSHVRIHF